MAAFNSTAIVDAGFKHRIVRAMFRRDVNPDGRSRASRLDEMLGDEKAATDDPIYPTEKDAETSVAKLVSESWKDIVSAVTMEGFGELLFKSLFRHDWDLVRLFPFRDCESWEEVRAHPKFQSHAVNVAGAIDKAVSLLGNSSELVPVLRGLGERHHGYGVEEEHYDLLGSALLEALEEGTALSGVSPGGRGLDAGARRRVDRNLGNRRRDHEGRSVRNQPEVRRGRGGNDGDERRRTKGEDERKGKDERTKGGPSKISIARFILHHSKRRAKILVEPPGYETHAGQLGEPRRGSILRARARPVRPVR